AALPAARRGKDAVEMADLEEAVDRVVGGLERKSRVLSEKERDIVAHHEIGHALVATSLPHADPVHKVTIIPRGVGALGATYQLPLEDRYLLTRSELEDRIAVLLGGRMAEEIIYGEISTGGHNDLERATEMARLMVMQYGMSEQLGPMTFGGGQQAMFLRGSGLPQDREYSEESARRIDNETRAIIDRMYDRVRELLTDRGRAAGDVPAGIRAAPGSRVQRGERAAHRQRDARHHRPHVRPRARPPDRAQARAGGSRRRAQTQRDAGGRPAEAAPGRRARGSLGMI